VMEEATDNDTARSERQRQHFYEALTSHKVGLGGNGFPSSLLSAVMCELQSSQLSRIVLVGSKLPVRLNDDDVINLVESLLYSNIQLSELRLLYHNITGDKIYL
jgi:hypothetical protein